MMKLRAIFAFLLAAAAVVIVRVGGPADAVAPAASSSAPYPPATCASIQVSTTNPLPGATITVAGVNFIPGAHTRIELHTKIYVLGHVTVKPDGTFSVDVALPAGVFGHHLIFAIGGNHNATIKGCPPNPVQIINIQPIGASSSSSNGNGGGTAFTGLDVLGLLIAAAALIGVGLLLNRRSHGARRA